MDCLDFAIILEQSVSKAIENIAANDSLKKYEFLIFIQNFQVQFESMLKQAKNIDSVAGVYPDVDIKSLLADDDAWQKAARDFSLDTAKECRDMTSLWMIQTLIEKSGQFYQQAAANTANLSAKLFFSSMNEAKGMLRRRIDNLLRILYNEAWEKVGFATLILGKDYLKTNAAICFF